MHDKCEEYLNLFYILAQSDWTKEPLTLCSSFDAFEQPDPCLFYEHFALTFVDVTGYVNLCSDISKGLYDRVGTYILVLVLCSHYHSNLHHIKFEESIFWSLFTNLNLWIIVNNWHVITQCIVLTQEWVWNISIWY